MQDSTGGIPQGEVVVETKDPISLTSITEYRILKAESTSITEYKIANAESASITKNASRKQGQQNTGQTAYRSIA